VVVIAHEAVSVTNPVVAFIDPNKSVEKVFAILIVLEDRFSLVTATGDVINSAWVFYPEGAYHIGIVSRCDRNIKTKDLTGCATNLWVECLPRSAIFPEILPAAAQDRASQSDDAICSFDRPMHAGLFEPLPDDSPATCFDNS
jgi:hypothetical protein